MTSMPVRWYSRKKKANIPICEDRTDIPGKKIIGATDPWYVAIRRYC